MIYIKYTSKENSWHWYIYAHEKGDKKEINIINVHGNTNPYSTTFNLKRRRKFWKIKYLTEQQVDLLKLERL